MNDYKKGRSIRIRIETGKRENGISNSRQYKKGRSIRIRIETETEWTKKLYNWK